MAETQALVVQQTDTASLMAAIQKAASDPNTDVAKTTALFDLYERAAKQAAEQKFNQAMRDVQEEMPRVKKDRKNEFLKSSYSTLEALNRVIVPIYTKHGFALSFGTADSPLPEHFRVTCVVSHSAGHSATRQCDVPLDMGGLRGNDNKTKTQAFGSTMSYGRRYLTLLIFNLSMTDEDNDAQANYQRISDKQAADLQALVDEVGADKPRFLKHMKVGKLEDIGAAAYHDAVKALEKKRRQPAKS